MFSWIVSSINETTKAKKDLRFVGVLDIFGFEDFKVSRLQLVDAENNITTK
jgi:myosin heavy subunit